MANISFKNVVKTYDNGVTVVPNLNLEIKDKEFVVLVGPSGCGKSTTLRMIAGLESVSEGDLCIGGRCVNDLPPKDRDIAMVFQNYALYPHMTVYKNMAFALELRKTPKDVIDQKVHEAARILELEPFLDRKPKALSGGQRQRVALGRAMVRDPEVFLLDEPLSNLDAKLRSDMRTELIQLHQQLKSTFIYVTHDQIEAMTMGTNIVVMDEGKIMQQGTPTEIHNDPNCVFVAQFVGDPGMNIIPCSSGHQIGFRPRDVEFDCGESSPDCVVVRIGIRSFENHGSEFLYLLDADRGKVFVKELSKTMRPIEQMLVFRIHREDLYVFDEAGSRIRDRGEIERAYGAFKRDWETV